MKPSIFLNVAGVSVLAAATQFATPVSAQMPAFTVNDQSKISIVLPQSATLAEQTAARELDHYLTRITGGEFTVQSEANAASAVSAIYVGNTAFAKAGGVDAGALASEEWRIKTQNNNLILAGGGTRGTLYATYRFLEDNAGVRWWNPWEEHVPARGALPIPAMDKHGKPVFSYRDIYMLYGHDNGRFAIRNRLNREGDAPFGAEYGGSRDYGPPYHAHTFYKIMLPSVYFKDHPDWFLVPAGGEPTDYNSQLRLSNPEMRQEFLKLLKGLIHTSHQAAKAAGLPAPDFFSVSQMDNLVPFADPNNPADTALVAENGGADAAVLLDFINFLADGIKDEFPGVSVETMAYFSGEKAPTKIRPRDNVIIRLTDTTSNLIEPITAPRNHAFRNNVEAWGKITKNLRVWDYAVTFNYTGLPMPTASTYPTDLRFLKANNVEGIFVEHEFPILSDMRDFKVWMQCKLFEDPYRDYDALVREFTDGFYGPAGTHVRQFLYALQDEAKKAGEAKGYDEVTWMAMGKQYRYLSLDFLIKAEAMFDEAERAAGNDAALQRRVRHARLSLDRFMLLYHTKLENEWRQRGNVLEAFPLNRSRIAARALQTWNEQIDLRLPEDQRASERTVASAALKHLETIKSVPTPTRFKDIPAANIEVYGMANARNVGGPKVVEEPESDIGIAARLIIGETLEDDQKNYVLPMSWGVYDTVAKKPLMSGSIKAEDVPGPGYNWYKMGEVSLTGNDYIYFFWSWVIQLDIADAFDSQNPDQRFEIWGNVKFEGPMYPHGRAEDQSAISVERVVLIKK